MVRALSGIRRARHQNEHAAGASATGVFAIGEVGGDPEAALFASDHELEAFGPSFDDAVEGEADRFAARDGAVEEFAVGGPAGIVDGDFVGAAGLFGAGSGGEDFGGEAGGGLFGIGGYGCYVGRNFRCVHVAGNFGEDGRECNWKRGEGRGAWGFGGGWVCEVLKNRMIKNSKTKMGCLWVEGGGGAWKIGGTFLTVLSFFIGRWGGGGCRGGFGRRFRRWRGRGCRRWLRDGWRPFRWGRCDWCGS